MVTVRTSGRELARGGLARLYHIAEAPNLPSILEHGLLSTEKLLGMLPIPRSTYTSLLRTHRPDHVRLTEHVVVRDQKPMPPAALAGALEDGMEPSDWYALLNRHVFLWPDRGRMERHLQACGGRPQVVLIFDGPALLDRFGSEAFVSPINSGNARRKPARRGRKTLLPYSTWLDQGWQSGQRRRAPAEILFRCRIPAAKPFLIDIARR